MLTIILGFVCYFYVVRHMEERKIRKRQSEEQKLAQEKKHLEMYQRALDILEANQKSAAGNQPAQKRGFSERNSQTEKPRGFKYVNTKKAVRKNSTQEARVTH